MFSRWGKIKTQVIESNGDAKGREQKGPKRMMNLKLTENRGQKAATCLLIHLFFEQQSRYAILSHMTNTCNLWTYFVTHDKSKANLLQVNHHLPLKWGLLKKQATSWMQLFKWGLLHWNLHRMPASFRCFGQNWRKRTCKRTWTSWASAPWLSSWLQCFGKYSLMKFGIFWTC